MKKNFHNREELKKYLDRLYLKYSRKYSSDDPVWILHDLKSKKDIEVLAFIISCFSYGRVEFIVDFISRLTFSINKEIFEFIINYNPSKDRKYISGFYYRFNTENDLSELFRCLSVVLKKYNNLENLFLEKYSVTEDNILTPLNHFAKTFNSFGRIGQKSSFRYLVPVPENNSACKRLNLFLRWLVRKDNIDFGLWENVSKSKLIIPVDTHVFRVSRELGLINRKSCDLKFALTLTDTLKKFDSNDPVKYDFALCHVGIEGF